MTVNRVLAVVSSNPEGPGVRHRWRAYLPHLAAHSIALNVCSWPKDLRGRERTLAQAAAADGVVVASRLLNTFDAARLRRHARRLAFDFDDALPFRDSSRRARKSFLRGMRFRAIVRRADRVFAGNPYLANLAAEAGGNATVLPTTVEVEEGPASPEPTADPPVLGWIGSHATIPYLEGIGPLLRKMAEAGTRFRVRVVADAEPRFPSGVPVEAVRWTLRGWDEALSACHVGIAPLPDDRWTRGKCGLKVLQMLSLGRPVVASAVGVQNDQVRHGETGFLAATPDEFRRGIETLLADPELRRAMGEAGLHDVRNRWSVAAWAPRVVEEVERLLR